jgi:hypothetical protein
MDRENKIDEEVEMRAEYDFSNAIQGKYARRFAKGSNVIILDPEVAQEFITSKVVNAALRKALKKRHNTPDQRASEAAG